MFTNISKIRVRYAETDQMSYVYYGNYPQYFEIGRVEALRELGVSYKKLEEDGIMLPVLDLNIKYIKPAKYDNLLTIKTHIKEIPSVRIKFYYEIFNDDDILLTKGETILVFVDMKTGKPTKCPNTILEKISTYIQD